MPTTVAIVVDSRIRVSRVTTRTPLPALNDQYSVSAKALFGTSTAAGIIGSNTFYAGTFTLASGVSQTANAALAGITNASFVRVVYKAGPDANPALTVSIAGWISNKNLKRQGYIDLSFGELQTLPTITLTAGTFTGTVLLAAEVYVIGNG